MAAQDAAAAVASRAARRLAQRTRNGDPSAAVEMAAVAVELADADVGGVATDREVAATTGMGQADQAWSECAGSSSRASMSYSQAPALHVPSGTLDAGARSSVALAPEDARCHGGLVGAGTEGGSSSAGQAQVQAAHMPDDVAEWGAAQDPWRTAAARGEVGRRPTQASGGATVAAAAAVGEEGSGSAAAAQAAADGERRYARALGAVEGLQ